MPNSIESKIFIKFLTYVGCVQISQKGSHAKFKKEGLKRPIIVPVKQMIYPDVINSNLKTLGISYKEFLEIISKL